MNNSKRNRKSLIAGIVAVTICFSMFAGVLFGSGYHKTEPGLSTNQDDNIVTDKAETDSITPEEVIIESDESETVIEKMKQLWLQNL